MEIIENNKGVEQYTMEFGCYDAYKENNTIWFSAVDHNGLYKMRLDNNETVKIAEFPNEDNIFELHRKVIVYNRILFFIPCRGRGISAYHLDTGKMEYFIPDDRNEIHACDAFLDDEVLWILPRNLSQPLYEFNIEQGVFYKHDEWNKTILKLPGISEKQILSLKSTCFIDKTMMTVISDTPYVIKTHIKDGITDIYYLSDEIRLRGITYDEGNYWLTLSKGGSVLYADFINKEVKIIDLDFSEKASFMNIIVDEQNQSIIVLPCNDTDIYRFYKNKNEAFVYKSDFKPNKDKLKLSLYMGWLKDENEILLLPSAKDYIEKYNSANEYKTSCNIRELKCKSNFYNELDYRSLNNFIDTVKYFNSMVKCNDKMNTYGNLIWEKTKDIADM